MTRIFRALEQILQNSEDYISHDAALYCNGLIADLPQRIVIATSSRRRDRVCEGYQIEFVYHNSRLVSLIIRIKTCFNRPL